MAVYKEGDKWRSVYRFTNYKGERKQTSKHGFATKKEALAWEREMMLKSESKLDMTFGSFFDIYTEDKKRRVKENTWESKSHIIRTKILPYFGDRKISEIEAKDVIAWQNEMLAYRDQAKHSYTDLINSFVQDEKNKLAVFDKNGVYLPTKKIGKNNPKAEEIAADNEVRKKWNGTVDHALVSGFDEPRILEIKQKEITNKTRESIIVNGKNPELFADIILKAIALLQSVLSAYISRNKVPFPKRPDKAEDSGSVNAVGASQTPRDTPVTSEKVKELEEPKLSKLGAKYERLSKIYGKLKKQNARIWSKENDVKILEQELADSTGIFKAIKRRELQDSIDILNVEIEQLKAGLEPIVEMYGYENVKSFMDEYNASKAAYEAYQDAYAKWKNPPKPSARKKLEEKKVESKNIDATRNKTKNKNHNASHDDD